MGSPPALTPKQAKSIGRNAPPAPPPPPPIIAGNTLFILDEYGTTTLLKTGTTFQKLGENKLEGERTLATPVPTTGAWFIRTEKRLYRIGKT